jgi:hypothetical protein
MSVPTEALIRIESAAPSPLVLRRPLAGDQHPALVYLARLGPGSRRTMAQALGVIAGLFDQTVETLDWSGFRYQHTQAVRARLLETRSPGGTNKILAALRGVLKEAWRLDQIDAEIYHRAADLPSVRGGAAAVRARVVHAGIAEAIPRLREGRAAGGTTGRGGGVGTCAWVSARAVYLMALRDALLATGLDCSSFISDSAMSMDRVVERKGNAIVPVGPC